jgi:N-acetyl-gamma-glutamyl-phosphate reductase
VLGASGYVGGELLRLLASHPGVAAVRAMSQSRAGALWADVHPALRNLPGGERELEAADPGAAGAWADVVFLALPHGSSQQVLAAVEAGGPRLVVDTAADFRLADRALAESVYGQHERADALGSFAYGLADVAGGQLAGARRIAVPGCFATAALLALWAVASGLGRTPTRCASPSPARRARGRRRRRPPTTRRGPTTSSPTRSRATATRPSSSEQLRAWCGDAAPSCRLLTHSAPLVRGIHATLRARVRAPASPSCWRARGRLSRAGRSSTCSSARPSSPPSSAPTTRTCTWRPADDTGEVLVFAVIDNLVKGAAGQAVQAMNLALGLDETAGLEACGLAPC